MGERVSPRCNQCSMGVATASTFVAGDCREVVVGLFLGAILPIVLGDALDLPGALILPIGAIGPPVGNNPRMDILLADLVKKLFLGHLAKAEELRRICHGGFERWSDRSTGVAPVSTFAAGKGNSIGGSLKLLQHPSPVTHAGTPSDSAPRPVAPGETLMLSSLPVLIHEGQHCLSLGVVKRGAK